MKVVKCSSTISDACWSLDFKKLEEQEHKQHIVEHLVPVAWTIWPKPLKELSLLVLPNPQKCSWEHQSFISVNYNRRTTIWYVNIDVCKIKSTPAPHQVLQYKAFRWEAISVCQAWVLSPPIPSNLGWLPTHSQLVAPHYQHLYQHQHHILFLLYPVLNLYILLEEWVKLYLKWTHI